MTEVTLNIPAGYRLKENHLEKIPAMYSIGMHFSVDGDTCMLCQVDAGKIAMISLKSGNRYTDPIIPKEGAYQVYESTIDRLVGNKDWTFLSENGHKLTLLEYGSTKLSPRWYSKPLCIRNVVC